MPLAPLEPFTSHLPVRVRFGDGVLAQLPEVLADLAAHRPIAFVDAAVAQLPARARGARARAPRSTRWPPGSLPSRTSTPRPRTSPATTR